MKIDLTGRRFGRLVAVRPTDERRRNCVVWACQCDCGTSCLVPSDWLMRGVKRSCGCMQDEARRIDITGQRRGKLTAIRPTPERRDGKTVWEWRCDCGATVMKPPGMVRKSMSTMCPECRRALNTEQINAARENAERVEEFNLKPASLKGLRSGKLYRTNTSGVRGVSWHSGVGKWYARISDHGKMRTIGYYSTLEDAAKARAEAVKKQYGIDE